MKKYTIDDFRKDYPNEAACLHKIWTIRYGSMETCPSCLEKAEFRRITTRKAYQCRYCYHQIHPLAGTIFHKAHTSLVHYFYAMYLIVCTRNGVAAKEIERQLSVSYPTALRMLRQIRKLMADKDVDGMTMKGFIEADETFFRSPHYDIVDDHVINRHQAVFGMAERLGNVKAMKIDKVSRDVIVPIIKKNVDKEDSIIYTDEEKAYKTLTKEEFTHKFISHSKRQYRINDITTNTIEGFWSQLKRMVKGTHIHVSIKYLQHYIDEACWRWNNRQHPEKMFDILIAGVVGTEEI